MQKKHPNNIQKENENLVKEINIMKTKVKEKEDIDDLKKKLEIALKDVDIRNMKIKKLTTSVKSMTASNELKSKS